MTYIKYLGECLAHKCSINGINYFILGSVKLRLLYWIYVYELWGQEIRDLRKSLANKESSKNILVDRTPG